MPGVRVASAHRLTHMSLLVAVLCAVFGGAIGWFAPEISTRKVGLEIPNNRGVNAGFGLIIGLLVGGSIGLNWVLPAWIWIIGIGTLLALIDLKHHRLPDVLVLPSYGVVAVLLLIPSFAYNDWDSYKNAIIAAVVTFVVYFLLALVNPSGMGLGDVKFGGVLGLALGYLGFGYAFMGFFAAFVIAGIVGIGLMIGGKAGRKTAIPFGPFMVIGAAVAIPLGLYLASVTISI